MLHLSANIRDIKVGDLAELVIAFYPNIFGNHVVRGRHRRDILLNIFQEGRAVLASAGWDRELFL